MFISGYANTENVFYCLNSRCWISQSEHMLCLSYVIILFCECRVPHDSLLLGNKSGFRSKGSAFNKFYEHWERWYVIRKPMWWWYLCFGYETELMIRLIEGRWFKLTVVDVFTLYSYVHVSLQITLLHVFPSKYNGKETLRRVESVSCGQTGF